VLINKRFFRPQPELDFNITLVIPPNPAGSDRSPQESSRATGLDRNPSVRQEIGTNASPW